MENRGSLIHYLIKQPKETEWIEFKKNKAEAEVTGQYSSAFNNVVAYHENDIRILRRDRGAISLFRLDLSCW